MTDSSPMVSSKVALKVAKWLATKNRHDESLEILVAWAVVSGNNEQGQELMAEALRVNPNSPLAKMAFERMEGVVIHNVLDALVQKWPKSEIEKIEKEIPRSNFIRAQVGFNNNIKYKGHTYHIQTEDSGLDKPHIVTHLFADGGRILKSHKRLYHDEVQRDDVANFVRKLMKSQHMEMALMLREGAFEKILAGSEKGGLEVLPFPPREDRKKNIRRDDESAPPPLKNSTPSKRGLRSISAHTNNTNWPEMMSTLSSRSSSSRSSSRPSSPPKELRKYPGDASKEAQTSAADSPPFREQRPVQYLLHVIRSAGGDPPYYTPSSIKTTIGSRGDIRLNNDRYCRPVEATLNSRMNRLWLSPHPGGKGAFLRVKHFAELVHGDEFIIGDQLLRVNLNPEHYDDGPSAGPTYFYSSPKWPSSFHITQIFDGNRPGACVLAVGNLIHIGSMEGDLVFGDPLVSAQHCFLEEQGGNIMLNDLDSRTGVFVRLRDEEEVVDGDELLVGRTRFKIEFLSDPQAGRTP